MLLVGEVTFGVEGKKISVKFQKCLGIYLDEKFNFNYHIIEKMAKSMKGIGVIKRLSRTPPLHSLLTIYKLFIWPHLDYVDVLYDQPIQYCSGHYLYHHQPAAKPTYNIHNHIGLKFLTRLRLGLSHLSKQIQI